MTKMIIAAAITASFSMGCASSTTPAPKNSNAVAATSSEEAPEAAKADIVDSAVQAGTFTSLVAAIQAAELVDALKGDGPFTVFAPSDDAFAKLPPGTVEALLQDKEKLTQILTYHVVPGRVMASDVSTLSEATTLQGGAVAIDTTDGVRIDDAKVVAADIEASNGVIHVIDTVLIPQG